LAVHAISSGTKAVISYRQNETQKKVGDKKRQTRASKAGLVFPVSKVDKYLKSYSKRVSPDASVFLTAVLEYLANELLTAASEFTSARKRVQISVHDVHHAVFGTGQHIHSSLVAKKKVKKGEEAKESDDDAPEGDLDLECLAKAIKWGVVRKGWKGLYTGKKGRKRKIAEVDDGSAVDAAPAVAAH
jgi:histone H3/H4